jgi:excisionase family DNA binding protein
MGTPGKAALQAVDSAPATSKATPRRAVRPTKRKPVVAVAPPEGRMAFNVRETAFVLGVSPNTIWNMLGAGLIESFMLGKRRLISRSALEKFMSEGGARNLVPIPNTADDADLDERPEPRRAGGDG